MYQNLKLCQFTQKTSDIHASAWSTTASTSRFSTEARPWVSMVTHRPVTNVLTFSTSYDRSTLSTQNTAFLISLLAAPIHVHRQLLYRPWVVWRSVDELLLLLVLHVQLIHTSWLISRRTLLYRLLRQPTTSFRSRSRADCLYGLSSLWPPWLSRSAA